MTVGEALEVFQQLLRKYKIRAVYSHEETGLDWSFKRDLKMKRWFRESGILWSEFRQFGVKRGPVDRDKWASIRSRIIERPLFKVGGQEFPKNFEPDPLPWKLLTEPPLDNGLSGGRKQADKILGSFLSSRSQNYLRGISSPLLADDCSSHLSPYIAWGNISLTEIHHALQNRNRELRSESSSQSSSWLRSLKGFESRLWWHCHFIQKLETEPEIEFRNFNRGFDDMRESEFREDYFQAWCKGETGFPMIDACMKALHQKGWINFRMRAMLMSFSSYQLWLHWRRPAQHLARLFVDFEPGIHYSQVQMQSGVTGINTIRIYSPVKQARDQDPNGVFIKKYIPGLAKVPLSDIFEPHNMPPFEQIESGFQVGVDYPFPIVSAEDSYRQAKERIFNWKKKNDVRQKAQLVFERHGSRRQD